MRNDLVKLPAAALPGTSVMDAAGENAIAAELPIASDAHPVPLQVPTTVAFTTVLPPDSVSVEDVNDAVVPSSPT